MTIHGRVTYQDLEGGIWLLVSDDGRRFQLQGGDAGLRRDGQAVEVEGDLQEDLLSFGMAEPILQVHSYTKR